jgi:hypothetical protein
MLPRSLTLVLIVASSAFLSKAQDQEKFIPATFASLSSKIGAASIKRDTVPCTCSLSPQIVLLSSTATSRTYEGIPNATCFPIHTSPGASGTAYNTNARGANNKEAIQDTCQQNVSYSWQITSGSGIATIDSGSINGPRIRVSFTGSGEYTIRLDNTVTCGGTTCTDFTTRTDSVQVEAKNCNCSVDVDCQRGPDEAGLRSYSGLLKGGCTGEYGQSPPYLSCNIKSVTWSWQITNGGNVIEIVGPADQQKVTVRVKGTGAYELRVQADVECNDGNKSCGEFNFDYCMDSASNEKACNINMEEKVEPLMDGGLLQRYIGSQKIERDGYIILGAGGADYDQVIFTCTPSSDCNEPGGKRTVVLNSRVRFLWSIVGGEGGFVSLGSLPDGGDDEGDHIIFKPPYVPLPQGAATENSKTTIVRLFIFDDNATQPEDPFVQKNITIITRRFKSSPDNYTVVVQGPVFKPIVPKGSLEQGVCSISEPTWQLKNDLKKPEIQVAPNVPDNDKIVIGEWAVLFAKDQRDLDKLIMDCISPSCSSTHFEKPYEDNVAWEWIVIGGAKNGRIVNEPNGRFVVYEAPEKMPGKEDMIEVKVQVTVKNADALKAEDAEQKGEITLKIFRAGVKLDFPRLDWVPQENNEVPVRSFLVYRDNGVWKPALAHQARIHYFELLDVSKETGVCMNDPQPGTADKCRDLFMGEASGHERYPDQNIQSCGGTQLYEKARTAKALKEYTINIGARDFGAYGFLNSLAALNNKPGYESVPVNYADFPHPTRTVNNPKSYKDNRVSIPRDIDNNHIADGGWPAIGGVTVPDPANNKEDDDNTPNGDGYNGDGFTAYEEYRGFKTVTNGVAHGRTNTARKDLFVHSADELSVNQFRQASGLVVHEISQAQYNGNGSRVVNFNSNPQTHNTDQLGLRLRNGGFNATLLGIQVSATNPVHPAPPNWTNEIIVYVDRIATFCAARNLSFSQKLLQVTAHELAHGCNVYHHGEGDAVLHGNRSGDMSCIMRYDNVPVLNPPEAIGSIFCTNAAGTGANANNPCITPPCFGSANTDWCRGACITQFRVSGRQNNYRVRLSANCKNN